MLLANRKGFLNELKEVIRKGLSERGESETRHCTFDTNLTVSVWQDTKPVTTCSTCCQSVPLDVVQRKLKNGCRKTFPCPHSITTYNKYMGGVDRNDQLREYYHVRLKSHKYYKYLFWIVFDIAITNTFVLAKANPIMKDKTKSMKAHRTALAQQLLVGYCSRKNIKRIIIPSEVMVSSTSVTIVPYEREERQHGTALTATYIYAIKV